MSTDTAPTYPFGILPLDVRIKELLISGRPLRGVFNGLPSPALVEMCAFAGFDFVVIDNEHGSASISDTEHMLRAARAAGIPIVVRCLESDLARTLDLGAGAVKIPMVQSAEHAASLVARIKYPLPPGESLAGPGALVAGRRGSAFSSRAAGYGAFGGPAHTRRSNAGVAFIAMVETPEAVEQAAAIAAVPGVDAVFVGPNDLAHAMGFDNRWHEPPVQRAMEKVLRAVSAAGKCAGVLALTAEEETRYAAWGARYFASTTTGIITRALREAAQGGRTPTSY